MGRFCNKLINKVKHNKKGFIYKLLKRLSYLWNKRKYGKYYFEGVKQDKENLIIVLAGYKLFCADIVYKRIKKFMPKNAELCLISSGMYSKELSLIAKTNNWGYISTKVNNICNALNIAIKHYEKANKIFKIDEDMFITKHFFDSLTDIYLEYENKTNSIKPLFYAPLIPINNFGFLYVIRKLKYSEKFTQCFKLTPEESYSKHQYYNNNMVARYLWGDKFCKPFFPTIDAIDEIFYNNKTLPEICEMYFNIGAILFNRKTWIDINGFKINGGRDMGSDESQLNSYSKQNNRPIIIATTTCVGHLSFGPTNECMKSYFLKNKKNFDLI